MIRGGGPNTDVAGWCCYRTYTSYKYETYTLNFTTHYIDGRPRIKGNRTHIHRSTIKNALTTWWAIHMLIRRVRRARYVVTHPYIPHEKITRRLTRVEAPWTKQTHDVLHSKADRRLPNVWIPITIQKTVHRCHTYSIDPWKTGHHLATSIKLICNIR